MNTRDYDVVAMGAGHNGLTAAAYLARAGKKVLVLERKAWPGGGVVTRELGTPGFWHDEHSSVHIMIQGNPLIRSDELGLFARHGLQYRYSDVPHATIFPDQSTIISYRDVDRTCESIAGVSPRDAEVYRRFATHSASILPMFMAGLYAPPPPLGELVALLDQNDEGRELLDAMQRSSLDLANQLFESDKLKIHLLRLVSENLQMPDELGTGMGLFLMPGIMHTYGVSQPVGGSGKLSEALVRCIESHGGEVRCSAEVRRILVSGGRAVGIELADGEQIRARDAVIGAIHPQRLRQFVEGVPAPVLQRAERTSLAPFSLFTSHYDLREQVRFHAGVDVGRATMLELLQTDSLREMLADFDELRQGRVSARRLVAGGDESIGDPTRAPPGRGLFHGITFAPYELAEGGSARWDEYKEAFADLSLAAYRHFTPSLGSANIIARTVFSPVDLERNSPNSMVRGDVHGVAPYFYQSAGHRPTPDLGQFRVPGVERLYLVGPFMHPGGGVYGAGRATAIQMFGDLGMDFERMVAGVRDDAARAPTAAKAVSAKAASRPGLQLRGLDERELMDIHALEREGDALLVKGKGFGTLPMVVKLGPGEARAGLRLLGWRRLLFLLTLPFRRDRRTGVGRS